MDDLFDRLHEMGACGCDGCRDPRMKVQRGNMGFTVTLLLPHENDLLRATARTLEAAVAKMLERVGSGVPEDYDPAEVA